MEELVFRQSFVFTRWVGSPSFSNTVMIFEAVILATTIIFPDFVTLVSDKCATTKKLGLFNSSRDL